MAILTGITNAVRANIAGAAKVYGINIQLPNKMFLKTAQELTTIKQNILNQMGG